MDKNIVQIFGGLSGGVVGSVFGAAGGSRAGDPRIQVRKPGIGMGDSGA